MKVTIANRGTCSREAIELIGISSKRNDPTQVGQFGSGTAYAVVLALREHIGVKIASRDSAGPYVMEPWLNDNDRMYWRIRANVSPVGSWLSAITNFMRPRAVSNPTSFTLGFGSIDWEGHWPVLREFVTNARDADPSGYAVHWGDDFDADAYAVDAAKNGFEDVTIVELDGVDHELSPATWSKYFRFEVPDAIKNHPDYYSPEVLHSFTPLISVMRADADALNAELFVKGVRVEHGVKKKSMFSWSIDTDLTEARTLRNDYAFTSAATSLLSRIGRSDSKTAARIIAWISAYPESFEAGMDMEYYMFNTTDCGWTAALENRAVATKTDEVKTDDAVVLPPSWKAGYVRAGAAVARPPLTEGSGPVVIANEKKTINIKDVARRVMRNAALDAMFQEGVIERPELDAGWQYTTVEEVAAMCKGLDVDPTESFTRQSEDGLSAFDPDPDDIYDTDEIPF
jgi:hypothetical protein